MSKFSDLLDRLGLGEERCRGIKGCPNPPASEMELSVRMKDGSVTSVTHPVCLDCAKKLVKAANATGKLRRVILEK